MSNFLGIATVTAGIRQLIRDAVEAAVAGADISTARPDAPSGVPDPRVNIFLYNVTPNPSFRNIDLPTRRSDGSLAARPMAALDLHYLLSFYGDESELVPQRLLGSTITALGAQPVITRDTIRRAIAAGPGTFLEDSNLAEQVESVRVSPEAINLEELSKLWSVFFQTPYVLSVAYTCSVVLLEANLNPQPSLPVRAANIRAIPFRKATIDRVVSSLGTNVPITSDTILSIRGSDLAATTVRALIDQDETTPAGISDTEVTVDLSSFPASVLRSGVRTVRLVYPVTMDDGTVLEDGFGSDIAPFVLRPTITRAQVQNPQGENDAPRSADIEVRVRPRVGLRQSVVMLLNEFNPPAGRAPRSYTFDAPSRDVEGAPDSTNTLLIPVSGLAPGRYLVRVQIDGAESLLETNPGGLLATPRITIS